MDCTRSPPSSPLTLTILDSQLRIARPMVVVSVFHWSLLAGLQLLNMAWEEVEEEDDLEDLEIDKVRKKTSDHRHSIVYSVLYSIL